MPIYVTLAPMEALGLDLEQLRDRRVWIVIGAAAFLLLGSVWLSVRAYRRAQARQTINSFAAFHDPPLDVQFPQRVADSANNRSILSAGVRNGIWTLHQRSDSGAMEVLLTNQGQRWFSVVEKQIIATFKAGSREATAVTDLKEIFPTRQVRFRYQWKEFHPAAAVLGEALPQPGAEYEGDAVLFYEKDRWRLMQWNTPEFDAAVARFRDIEPAK